MFIIIFNTEKASNYLQQAETPTVVLKTHTILSEVTMFNEANKNIRQFCITSTMTQRENNKPDFPQANEKLRIFKKYEKYQYQSSYSGYGSGTLNLLHNSFSGCHSNLSLVSLPNIFIFTAVSLSSVSFWKSQTFLAAK